MTVVTVVLVSQQVQRRGDEHPFCRAFEAKASADKTASRPLSAGAADLQGDDIVVGNLRVLRRGLSELD